MQKLRKIIGIASIILGICAGIHSAAAHHSGAMFDSSKRVTITGAVKQVRWVNPHVSLTIFGTTKPGEERKMTSPSILSRLDRTKATFKPGRPGYRRARSRVPS